MIEKVGENWKCPYCGHAQVIAETRYNLELGAFYLGGGTSERGKLGYFVEAIACANSECGKLSLSFGLVESTNKFPVGDSNSQAAEVVQSWVLLPPSSAKPQPDYIPEPLRDDYEEACAIRDLSPKASATITRRCLQGMIRDFCDISKSRLIDEINELRRRVEAGQAPAGVQADTVEAIDHVRGVGNIGAHMEADINVIIDVDANEAQVLIELVEMLFAEWYVARQQRARHLEKLKSIAAEKKEQKAGPPAG